MMTKCPRCNSESLKMIYAGLPLRKCTDLTCACAWGLGSYAAAIWFTGAMMAYEGSYWRALWHWLTGPLPGEDE